MLVPVRRIGLVVTRNLRRLLKDETGASLSLALLLFLVCTVVASVVLIAGTTASGRMANLADMDQKYYSVTSAVELLRDQLEEESADSDNLLTVTESLTYKENATSNGDSTDFSYTVSSNVTPDTLTSVPESVTGYLGKYLVLGSGTSVAKSWTGGINTTINESQWYDLFTEWENKPIVAASAKARSLDLDMSANKGGSSVSELDVMVTATFNDDGSARLVFKSDPEAENGIVYEVRAMLVPDFDISASSVMAADGSVTETKTISMRWEIANVTSERVM